MKKFTSLGGTKSIQAPGGGGDAPHAGGGSRSAAEEVAEDTRYRNTPGTSHMADAAEDNPRTLAAAAAQDSLPAAAPMGNPVAVEGKEIRTLSKNQFNELINLRI